MLEGKGGSQSLVLRAARNLVPHSGSFVPPRFSSFGICAGKLSDLITQRVRSGDTDRSRSFREEALLEQPRPPTPILLRDEKGLDESQLTLNVLTARMGSPA